jgi:hypothetical protein
MSNYPAGVSASHPCFNPPTSPCCGDNVTEHDDGTLTCGGCGESVMTAEDYELERADFEYDERRGN